MDEEERQREVGRAGHFERLIKANLANRAIYRWVLEFLRNCMVVAALLFLAQKSGNWWLWIITIVSAFVLIAYCYTYVENAWFGAISTIVPSGGWRVHVGIVVGATVTGLALLGVTAGIYVTLDKIVSVQFQSTKSP